MTEVDINGLINILNSEGNSFLNLKIIDESEQEYGSWNVFLAKFKQSYPNSQLFFYNCEFKNNTTFFIDLEQIKVGFLKCKFESELNLLSNVKTFNADETFFSGSVFIGEDSFESISFKNCVFDNGIELKNNLVFEQKFFFDSCVFLKKSKFEQSLLGSEVRFFHCNLSNVSFIESYFLDAKFQNCWFDFSLLVIEQELNKPNFTNLESVINVLRQFEIVYDKLKNYNYSGEFHRKRFELDRKHAKKSLKKFLLSLYKWSSDYGEDYKKSLKMFGLFFLIFAIIYMLFGLIYNGEYRNLEVVINNFSWGKLIEDFNISLLYSFNNAIPLKKDLEYLKSANIYTSFFSILETFIQTILAALFVIGLRRKFKR